MKENPIKVVEVAVGVDLHMKEMREMTDALRKVSAYAKNISKGFGTTVKDLDEVKNRLEGVQYLKIVNELVNSIGDELQNTLLKEQGCLDKFFTDQERMFAAMRNELKPVEKPIERHIDIAVSGSPVLSGSPGSPGSPGSSESPGAPEISEHVPLITPATDMATNGWSEVAKRGKIIPSIPGILQVPGSRGRDWIQVLVAKDTNLQAIPVPTMNDCKRSENLGNLCYATDKKTFCMSVNGIIMIYGPGMPSWYPKGQTPYKALVNKYLKKGQLIDPKKNEFFVPLEFATEADQINFTNRSPGYLPIGADTNSKDEALYALRVGDRDNFLNDIRGLHENHIEYVKVQNWSGCAFLTCFAMQFEIAKQNRNKRHQND
jgi:hypothetical protein